jgi:hypothetical protein
MSSPTTVKHGNGNGAGAAPPVPFVRAAHEHTETVQVALINAQITANPVVSQQVPIPAYGYLRNIALSLTTSGGVVGSATLTGDGLWKVIRSVQIFDTNGSPITAPISGWELMLMNKYGYMAASADPQVGPDFASGAASMSYVLRIPVELLRGFGSLPNQNAAAPYKMQVTLGTLTDVYSVTTGLTAPTVQIDAWLEAWSKPAPFTPTGRAQMVEPPRAGTTQRWWFLPGNTITAGSARVVIPQVGNKIRTLIFVVRDGTGVRRGPISNMPDPIELWWDNRQQFIIPLRLLRKYMAERIVPLGNGGYTGVENGVLVFDYSHDVLNQMSGGTDLYLPTVQATRLELRAANWAAGSVDVLVNDVTPVEVSAAGRYTEPSATAFHPQVGEVSPNQT